MGSACTVGFGLAMAQRNRPVLVVTGDGEMLMGLGAIASIAQKLPPNLTVAVIDNGHYGETGMQLSHSGRGIELSRIAGACDFAWSGAIDDMAGVEALRARIHAKGGTAFATRSEEHKSELQSLMRNSYAGLSLNKKNNKK